MTEYVECNSLSEMNHYLIDALERNMVNVGWEEDGSNDVYTLNKHLTAWSGDDFIVYFFKCGRFPIPQDRLKVVESRLKIINISLHNEPLQFRDKGTHEENYVLRKHTIFKRDLIDYFKIEPVISKEPTDEEKKALEELRHALTKPGEITKEIARSVMKEKELEETYGKWIAAFRHNGDYTSENDELLVYGIGLRDREIEKITRIIFEDALNMDLNW